MTRSFITFSKFYDIRRYFKKLVKMNIDFPIKGTANRFEINHSTVSKVIKAKNFKEYKLIVNLYSRIMKKLKRRVLFILGVLVVVLAMLNLR